MTRSTGNKQRWALLDIGNVLWSDDGGDAFTLANIGRELALAGIDAAPDALERASRDAVAAYAPSIWRAVIWRFTAPDAELHRRIASRVQADWDGIGDEDYRSFTPAFDGVGPMLTALREAGWRLALASNNTPRALTRLEELGWLQHFDVREVSDTLGLAKPDARFFMSILDAAACEAAAAVMVGDRLCNDIGPARLLGMRTVRVRKGLHQWQEARSPWDLPDLDIQEPARIAAALAGLEL